MFAAMWRVLTRPSLGAFEDARADHRANLGRAILSTLAIGAATGFVGGLTNLLLAGDSLAEAVALMILTPLRFLFALIVVQAFLFAAARTLGGRGEFATQAYLGALVFVPLTALSSLLAAIPTIGAGLAFIALLYGIAVSVLALRAAHGGPSWRVANAVLFVLSLVGGFIGWVAISSIPS